MIALGICSKSEWARHHGVRWNLTADSTRTPEEYMRLKNEIETNGEILYNYGPASVYGESAEVYRFNNKLYKILRDMYGAKQIGELQGDFIRISDGRTLYANKMETESGIQFIIGYRAWNYYEDKGNVLYSLVKRIGETFPWQIGENIAKCRHRNGVSASESIPISECDCGYHAWKTLEQLKRSYPPEHSPEIGYFRILGTVALYGTVVEHELGYRAEKAQIIGIFNTFPNAAMVAKKYDADLLPSTQINMKLGSMSIEPALGIKTEKDYYPTSPMPDARISWRWHAYSGRD